jgi:hypothetical protein
MTSKLPITVAALATHVSLMVSASPAPTAGDIDDAGIVKFRVTDVSGSPIPCRLSFIAPDGSRPELFPNADADPERLAVRRNTVYTITGNGQITVPPGRYTVWASHGLEWSVASVTFDVEAGENTAFALSLEHQVDTTGWVSGDFHLHTLTYSGHGDSNMPERIISIVGEGVEFAVATDHNHNTDYLPTMKQVGADPYLTSVTGNEVSTPIGHFNAFPLEPDRPIPPHQFPAAEPMFKFIREEPNRFGVVPIIQLNHPRWSGINYFGQTGLDPITGVSDRESYSDDFDTIEIFNENENWGYFDPDLTDLPISSGSFSVLRDWYNLLNRGHTAAAVGNSDSHDVESEIAGIPRNFIRSSTDDPSKIDPAEIVEMQRKKMVFTTSGPFIEYKVNGADMGSTISLDEPGEVTVAVRVQAADWIDCDVVKVVVNGDVVRQIPVSQTREVERLKTTVKIPIESDSWLTLLAEGDESLAPIVHDQGRPILPIAVMNPVWIDADGDGDWTSPVAQAEAFVERARSARLIGRSLPAAPAWERALIARAIGNYKPEGGPDVIARLLGDEDRFVRLSAARAAEKLATPTLLAAIADAARRAGDDAHLRMALFAADLACGVEARTPQETRDALFAMLQQGGKPLLSRFSDRLMPLIGGEPVRDFQYVGMFESPSIAEGIGHAYAPETEAGPYATKTGTADWAMIRADARGYVNLLFADDDPKSATDAVAYLRTWVVSPDDRETMIAYGTDDGSRLWINGELIVEDTTDHSADPLQHVGTMRLVRGMNTVLLKVANGGGEFGAYFRVLDGDVRVTAAR